MLLPLAIGVVEQSLTKPPIGGDRNTKRWFAHSQATPMVGLVLLNSLNAQEGGRTTSHGRLCNLHSVQTWYTSHFFFSLLCVVAKSQSLCSIYKLTHG